MASHTENEAVSDRVIPHPSDKNVQAPESSPDTGTSCHRWVQSKARKDCGRDQSTPARHVSMPTTSNPCVPITDKVGNARCECASEPWVIVGFYKCENWEYGMQLRATIAVDSSSTGCNRLPIFFLVNILHMATLHYQITFLQILLASL